MAQSWLIAASTPGLSLTLASSHLSWDYRRATCLATSEIFCRDGVCWSQTLASTDPPTSASQRAGIRPESSHPVNVFLPCFTLHVRVGDEVGRERRSALFLETTSVHAGLRCLWRRRRVAVVSARCPHGGRGPRLVGHSSDLELVTASAPCRGDSPVWSCFPQCVVHFSSCALTLFVFYLLVCFAWVPVSLSWIIERCWHSSQTWP